MIGLPFVYAVTGVLFALYALFAGVERRFGNAAFWALLAISFLLGDRIGDIGNGVLVLGLVALAGTGLMRRPADPAPDDRETAAARWGDRLFVPILIVPAIALIGTLGFKQWPGLVDPKQATLVSLVLGVLIALVVAMLWLRPRITVPLREGLRLMESVGWAGILPQMLASLGAIFALAGVGKVIGGMTGALIPDGSLIGAVVAYGFGMALFTMVMGNAFAAFPVMMAAIGMPLLIGAHHGDPAIVCAIGMLAGFCGTLLTPMAANFNVVPAVLLDLKDRHGVIRAQAPTALPLLAINILLLYWLAF